MSKSNNSFSGKKREKNKIETSSSGSDEKNDLAGSTVKIVFKSQKISNNPKTEEEKNQNKESDSDTNSDTSSTKTREKYSENIAINNVIPTEKPKLNKKFEIKNAENDIIQPEVIPIKKKKTQEEVKCEHLTNEICFQTKYYKLPELIKSILRQELLCEENWDYYDKINKHLKKLYERSSKKTISSARKFMTVEITKDSPESMNKMKEISKNFILYQNIKKDGNSFYRAVGLICLINWIFEFKKFKSLKNKDIYLMIQNLDQKDSLLDFLKIDGIDCNMDLKLINLLQKPKFLNQILKKYLCLFIHMHFEFKEYQKEKSEKELKQKLWKFVIQRINKNPILDVALVVFMRWYFSSDLKKEYKDILKPHIFGKEAPLNILHDVCKNKNLYLTLINIESKKIEPEINGEEKHQLETGLCYNDESYKLVFGKENSNIIYDYENKMANSNKFAFKILNE